MIQELPNPFLGDNFAPVSQEITQNSLKISGQIPPQLQGTFVRNGPNPQVPPLGEYHWFDGDGMLHAVEIAAGKATYRNRYVKTQGYLREKAAGTVIYGGLGSNPEENPENDYKNASNTALVWHAEKLLSLWEGGQPYNIALPNLDTLGIETFNNELHLPFTAHPKVDPLTQEMMFISYRLMSAPFVHYGVVNAKGKIEKIIPIEIPVGVMMHDFAITENHTIILNLPLTFRLSRLAQGKPAFQFESKTPSYWGILPRNGNKEDIRWFESDPCFVFHTLNAYEEGDEVVLIACRMAATNVLGLADDPEIAAKGDIPLLTRWRFNLQDNSVKEETLDTIPSEFPRINEHYLGRKNRYGYTAKSVLGALPLFDGVIKYDFETGQSWHYNYGANCYGGEVVFAANPQGKTEDDGWLITFVYDQDQDTSQLIILDAQNLESTAIARIEIPQRVPYGFHGLWIG